MTLLSSTALLLIDPYNDFLSEGGKVWSRVKPKLLDHLRPGDIHTHMFNDRQVEMLDRFTGGSEEAKGGLLSMMPAKRAATPEEIAQTIVFLAGDKDAALGCFVGCGRVAQTGGGRLDRGGCDRT